MKTNASHTPGPWHWVGTNKNPKAKAYLQNAEYDQVAVILYDDGPSEPNARLIASAPDLLAACETALKVFEAWKHDANPHGDLKRGEVADHDAACDMAALMQTAILKATEGA